MFWVYFYINFNEFNIMNYIFKMIKVVNFMIFIFYCNRENMISVNNGKVLWVYG